MFKILIIRELQNYLYSLRFQISFIIVLLVFIIGTISYIAQFNDSQNGYAKLEQDTYNELLNKTQNVSLLATDNINYYMNPSKNDFIDNCKENVIPNQFTYSAYNVFGFNVRHGNNNPLMEQVQGLNWAFIISMIISFMTLLLAFDAISGEKEDRTLALVFSNGVSRGSFILSKLLSIVIAVLSVTIIGAIASTIILMLSGKVSINGQIILEIFGFLLVSLLYISAMAVIGLTASVLSKQSNISLLVCLSVWIFFIVILPNLSVFFANKFFPITNATIVNEAARKEYNNYRADLPPDAENSDWGNPFFETNKNSAEVRMTRININKRYNDDYYKQMFRQFENTRKLGIISPVAQFEYMNEAILGGGYLRFQKNWNDLHIFQEQFLSWFKNIDAKDTDSPHWYDPISDNSTSRQSVAIDMVPIYIEKPVTFSERISFMSTYLIAIILFIGIVLCFCFVRFLRYDVR